MSSAADLSLGLDLGTASLKAALVDQEGRLVALGRASYPLHTPRPGWVEADPEQWWSATSAAVQQLAAPLRQRVGAIGLSGQMHGVVLTGADGQALRGALTWADSRAVNELSRYQNLPEPQLAALANPLAPGMAGPLLLWLMRHEGATVAGARWALQPKDWLRLRLTGEAAGEPSDASATLLFDVVNDCWALATVAALGLPDRLLPPLVPSAAVAGRLVRSAAEHLGLRPGIPVVAGAADTAAAILGSGLQAGEVQLTVGSGAQLVKLRQSLGPPHSPSNNRFRAATSQGWYELAAVHNAGITLEWVLGVLGLSWQEAYALAAQVSSGSDGVSFEPYLAAERGAGAGPGERGAWHGLGLAHGRGQLVRAALEGVARLIAQTTELLGPEPAAIVLAGGGVGEPLWREILSETLGRPLRLTEQSAVSARGAALLAKAAAGGSAAPA